MLTPPSGRDAIVDILVVGGGIQGVAVARDAALRGLSVLLLEAGDLASGTSSRSSKLIHGGIRYLETGQIALVHEALRERAVLLRTAAEYVRPLPFLIPHYQGAGRPAAVVEIGLLLYAALAGRHELARHGRANAAEAAALEGMLARPGLRGASRYWDAQVDDAALCVALAVHAEESGAEVRSHTSLVSLRREGNAWRAAYRDAIDGAEGEATAGCVVNAAGPWADEIRALARGGIPGTTMRRTHGAHVVVADLPLERALLLTARRDGRVFFALPWGSHTLIGTTDVDDAEPPRAPGPSPEDIRYLTEEAARALPAAEGLRPVRAFAGLRSLVRTGASLPWANPREHRILIDDGMMSLIGGKYTTHRSLAERVVDRAVEWLGKRAAPCSTATTPLPAGRGAAIAELEAAHPARLELAGGLALSEAEVAHAVTKRKARRLEDVLLRRTRLWLDGRALRAAARPASAWMAPLLSWSDERRDEEVSRVLRALDQEALAIEKGGTWTR